MRNYEVVDTPCSFLHTRESPIFSLPPGPAARHPVRQAAGRRRIGHGHCPELNRGAIRRIFAKLVPIFMKTHKGIVKRPLKEV